MTRRNDALRAAIALGYANGTPIVVIAAQAGSTPGSVKVLAHRMKLTHSNPLSRGIPKEHREAWRFFTQYKRLPPAYVRKLLGLEAAAQ